MEGIHALVGTGTDYLAGIATLLQIIGALIGMLGTVFVWIAVGFTKKIDKVVEAVEGLRTDGATLGVRLVEIEKDFLKTEKNLHELTGQFYKHVVEHPTTFVNRREQ